MKRVATSILILSIVISFIVPSSAKDTTARVAGRDVKLSLADGDLSKAFNRRKSAQLNPKAAVRHAPDELFLDLNGEKVQWGTVNDYIDLLFATSPINIPPQATPEQVQGILADLRWRHAVRMGNAYIRDALLAQKARSMGIVISSGELQQALTNSIRRVKGDARARLLKSITKPESYLYRREENYLLTLKYREAALTNGVEVTAEEIAESIASRKRRNESARATNACVRASMVRWGEEIRAGKRDFAAVAEEHSECTSSDENGIWREVEQDDDLEPEIMAFAFSAQTNAVSDVVETPTSYHLLKIVERKFEDGADSAGRPSSVVLSHILVDKIPELPLFDEAGARTDVFSRKLGKLTVQAQREALAEAKISCEFPITLLKERKVRK